MSRLRPSPLVRSGSRSSLVSDTTYHSLHEMELFEPVASSSSSTTTSTKPSDPPSHPSKEAFSSAEMRRQDSGYESIAPRPSMQTARRRTSTTSSSASRPKRRASVRRSSKSGPAAHLPRTSGQSLRATAARHAHLPSTYFHFPTPTTTAASSDPYASEDEPHPHPTAADLAPLPFPFPPEEPATPPPPPPPPATTHYWTSDRTRRLEYAAIDAASRGLRGWARRHLVPDCFVPQTKRRLTFDDDTGSVRRYRLELETEESGEKEEGGTGGAGGKRRWWFGRAKGVV